ncbi:alpha-1,2-mannosyltransferase (Kre5) [Scheffersomyces spartinae]|uniref:Alpha-1,2-mannosyltransferase (Kre5) n=1 Tax=Scheffersomyces spartinae TaxID=45513 RepID=A0A9P8AJ26_9ASCO|nr:alpha-1,2-mannosyltransferase (Kre5) [Scheffersomyces spartinae]KAG7194399.1 alpha-1,2-mannosyltransferase (Kre5) [Scheffersomyces spartinae]
MLIAKRSPTFRYNRSRLLFWAVTVGLLILTLIVFVFGGNVTDQSASDFTLFIDPSLPTPNSKQVYPPGAKITDKYISSKKDSPFQIGCLVPQPGDERADAVLVVLARNSELKDVINSMSSLERHFNQWYNYPWVFLNDEPFDEEFKKEVMKYTNSKVEFGQIPIEEWNFKKESVDPLIYEESINGQGDRKILYGNMESYHKMCRFFLGYFYKHELVKKHEWYWRVEPGVEFYCDITYDPFLEMESRGKKYAFTVFIGELYYTVPGLFKTTKQFIKERAIQVKDSWNLFNLHPKKMVGSSLDDFDDLDNMDYLSKRMQEKVKFDTLLEKQGKTDSDISPILLKDTFTWLHAKPKLYEDRFEQEEYNLCHFWSNFEIAKTSLFRSSLYEDYFQYLENAGGFYKERWGDAPVHLLAVGMLLDLKEIHYFRDIGYKHSTLIHCPKNAKGRQVPYEPALSYTPPSARFGEVFAKKIDKPEPNGVGCRCRCPTNGYTEMEESSCLATWVELTNDDYHEPKPINLDDLEKRIGRQIRRLHEAGKELHRINVA